MVMERDFLGIYGRDSGEDTRGSHQEAAFLGGSAVQWPFSNKVSAMQQFMLYKAAQEEKPRNYVFDKHSSSRFQAVSTMDAYEVNQKFPHAFAAQKYLDLDRQGFNQYPMPAYQPQNAGSFDASRYQLNEARTFPVVSHHSIPVTMSSPIIKVQSAHSGPNMTFTSPVQQTFGGGIAVNTPVGGPVVGTFAPRSLSKPTNMTAQLTIFYAGYVNVYDDVPFDKAQEIMSLASKGSSTTSNAVNPRSEGPLPTKATVPTKVVGSNGLSTKQTLIPTPTCVVSPCSGLSSPLPVTSHTVASSGSSLSTNDDTSAPKAVNPLVPTSLQETSKTSTTALCSETMASNMPRAVPQARKASLARFLEKRKQRMTNVMPYFCPKITPENGSTLESCNVSSISS